MMAWTSMFLNDLTFQESEHSFMENKVASVCRIY